MDIVFWMLEVYFHTPKQDIISYMPFISEAACHRAAADVFIPDTFGVTDAGTHCTKLVYHAISHAPETSPLPIPRP